jgi:hypothetical protein
MSFSHWLVDENRGVSSETPEKQQVSMMIDGIPNPAPGPSTYFYQKDIKLVNMFIQEKPGSILTFV